MVLENVNGHTWNKNKASLKVHSELFYGGSKTDSSVVKSKELQDVKYLFARNRCLNSIIDSSYLIWTVITELPH